jgi:hypothetical protein
MVWSVCYGMGARDDPFRSGRTGLSLVSIEMNGGLNWLHATAEWSVDNER